jgi:L-fucose isomerase-like protein
MVSKKELLKRIASLEEENARLSKENTELKENKEASDKTDEQITMLFSALKAINMKVNRHIKGEERKKEEDDKIQGWLKDDRVDEIQDFLHKGVK